MLAFLNAGLLAGHGESCDPGDESRQVALKHLMTLSSLVQFSFQVAIGSKQINMDQDLLSSLLNNLLQNALDAMPNGGTLKLAASSDKDSLYLKVKDTGIAIDEDRLPFIFSSMRSTKKGMGLGLATVKRIVDAFGGFVDVKSKPGLGTTFLVALPLTRAEAK